MTMPIDIATQEAKAGYLDYKLFSGSLDELPKTSKTVISTLNQ